MNESATPKGYLSKVKFQVTEENIKEACKADSRHCMIADAIAARLPGVRNISVDMMHIRWSDPVKGWRYIYMTPKPAQFALIRYDMGLESKPFNFVVRSGLAHPMTFGTGKNRKRKHKVPESKILKVTDHGTIVHSVSRDPIPMCVKDGPPESESVPKTPGDICIGPDYPPMDYTKPSRGRPKEWHPSHNSLRRFGMVGFTEGFWPKDESISAYFAGLGRKAKGTAMAKERAKKAAAARWRKPSGE